MKICIDNFDSPDFEIFDINLVQKQVDGGQIDKSVIDTIQEYPDAESIIISGLRQDTFEYFINRYGKHFRAISLWKNKLISDLSPLSSLTDVEYICIFFNQRTDSLWDMSDNRKLTGLSISDFSRLHNIELIRTGKSLKAFSLYDRVEGKMEIDSLKPLCDTNISRFAWGGKNVVDNDFKCLSDSNISELDISPSIFTIQELAELNSCFPQEMKGSITRPYITGRVKDKDGYREYYYLCKGQKKCEKGKDDSRFNKYLEEYRDLLSAYRNK